MKGTHSLKKAEEGTKSGYRKKPTNRGPLTLWRPHREGQVRTHRFRPIEAHSQAGDRTGRDKSGHAKNPTDRGPLTSWRRHREGQVRTRKESDRPRSTHNWRRHREGQFRTCKESERLRPTHVLETAQGGTSQDTQRIRPTEAHSLSGDGTGRDKSGHAKNPTDQGPLTS